MVTTSPYALTFCSAGDDGSLYAAGVVEELEDRDVLHTIIWERIGGQWERLQWKNRSYGMISFSDSSGTTTAYLGFEGTLKVRSQINGSSVQVLESGNDGPSSLRTVTCIRRIGEYLFVVGMRRMVYRRAIADSQWMRFDKGMRLARDDLTIAGLRSIDGSDNGTLVAVGLEGEIWSYVDGRWRPEDSPTSIRLACVRCVGDDTFVVGGADGTLIAGGPGNWKVLQHDFSAETFRCIERWQDRCFVGAESGMTFELDLAAASVLIALQVEGMPRASWISAARDRIYFVGGICIRSLGPDGWRDESPPANLLV